jgi:dolichyl-phosphate beta-glucosyltransferase
MKPLLSLVFPAYNEEKRLPATLEQVVKFIQAQPYSIEVLVIENGSTDRTYEIASSYAERYPQICVLQNKERGKGLAVRQGMLAARGEYRFMCDVDLSMRIQEVNRFLPPAVDSFDIAIASREAPGAVRFDEPQYRHLVGRGYNLLIRLMALPGLHDTQCGFKCFRGEIAERFFPLQTLAGWAFDVEVLYIGRLHGCRIVEVPIHWYFNHDSKVRVVHDAVQMGRDLLKIRLNAWRGLYGKK